MSPWFIINCNTYNIIYIKFKVPTLLLDDNTNDVVS